MTPLYSYDILPSLAHVILGYQAAIVLLLFLIYIISQRGNVFIGLWVWLAYLISQVAKCSNNVFSSVVYGLQPHWDKINLNILFVAGLFAIFFITLTMTLILREYLVNYNKTATQALKIFPAPFAVISFLSLYSLIIVYIKIFYDTENVYYFLILFGTLIMHFAIIYCWSKIYLVSYWHKNNNERVFPFLNKFLLAGMVLFSIVGILFSYSTAMGGYFNLGNALWFTLLHIPTTIVLVFIDRYRKEETPVLGS